jgi:hypothetical protein
MPLSHLSSFLMCSPTILVALYFLSVFILFPCILCDSQGQCELEWNQEQHPCLLLASTVQSVHASLHFNSGAHQTELADCTLQGTVPNNTVSSPVASCNFGDPEATCTHDQLYRNSAGFYNLLRFDNLLELANHRTQKSTALMIIV